MLPTILTYLTIITAVVVVAVLVFYLVQIIVTLRRAGDHLEKLARGLQAIKDNTQPLPDHLTTINGALGSLHDGLESVDGHLVGVAQVLKLMEETTSE
jgi:uncharacterized phage infection (PIP) family protein YhgE